MKRILIVYALMLCVITNSCESKPLNYIQFEEQETNAVTEKSIELEFNHELSYEVFPQNGLETRLSDGFELSYSSTDDIVVFISEYDGKTMFLYKNLNSGNILPICSDSVCTHKSGDECPACDISGITLFNYSYSDGTLYYATSVIDEAGMKEGYADTATERRRTGQPHLNNFRFPGYPDGNGIEHRLFLPVLFYAKYVFRGACRGLSATCLRVTGFVGGRDRSLRACATAFLLRFPEFLPDFLKKSKFFRRKKGFCDFFAYLISVKVFRNVFFGGR